jgi:hypothetical protein
MKFNKALAVLVLLISPLLGFSQRSTKIDLGSQVQGTLPKLNGGTGVGTTNNALINASIGSQPVTLLGVGAPSLPCSSTVNLYTYYVTQDFHLYQCSNNNGGATYLWNNISIGGGGGTTTNPLSFNTSGGAAPGASFNGSAAVAIDYHTVGAPSATGTGASGTWPISISGASASVGSTGGNGTYWGVLGGVQGYYTPTPASGAAAIYPPNTGYVIYGDSRVAVTGSSSTGLMTCGYNGLAITASTITGSVGTFTATQAQSAGDFITLYGFTGLGSVLNGEKVVILSTGLSGIQFEANVTGISSGTTGAGLYGCTQLPSTLLANSPLLPSSSTVNLQAVGNAAVSDLISNYAALVHPLSPAITGKPGILILQGGVGDIIEGGGTTGTVETNLRTLWAMAHTDGFTVMAESLIPHTSTIYNGNTDSDILTVNTWMRGQGPTATPAGAGEYWDSFADVAQDLANDSDTNLFLSNQHLTDQGNGYVFNNISSNLLAQGTAVQSTSFCYYTQGCPNLNVANIFAQSLASFGTIYAQYGGTGGPQVGVSVTQYPWIGGQYQPFTYAASGSLTPYLDTFYTFNNSQIQGIHTGNYQSCWNSYVGTTIYGLMFETAPTFSFSLDQTVNNQINLGNCGTLSDFSGGMKLTFIVGPAIAPSGSCTGHTGQYEMTNDGAITYCPASTHTWTSYGGSFTAAGDLSGSSSSQEVVGLESVPFCTSYSPINGDFVEYTTGGTPSPCYGPATAPSGSFSAGGDLSGSSSSQQVVGINSVPLCTGFTPTNGQNLQYTTGLSPNPCYTAVTPSGGGGAWTNISSAVTWTGCTYASGVCTVTGPVGNLDISAIPGTYSNIKIVAVANTSSSYGPGQTFNMIVNADSGNNYDSSVWETNPGGTGAVAQQATGAINLTGVAGSSVANSSTALELFFPQYANSTSGFWKICQGTASEEYSGGVSLATIAGAWHNTVPITELTFQMAGNYETNGSTWQIFGQN